MNNGTIAPPESVRLPIAGTSKEAKIQRSRFPMKKTLITAVSAVTVLTAVVAGTLTWRYMSSHESTDDAYVDGNLTQISSRLNGTVSQVLVAENQYVRAGQPLVVM